MARIVPHFLRKRLHFFGENFICMGVREKSAVRKNMFFS